MLLKYIIKHGRVKSVILITLSAVIASILATRLIFFFMGKEMPVINQFLSVFIPMIIASLWSWRTVGMILKIHELEQEIRQLANFDSLTGVMSRSAFLSTAASTYQLMMRKKSSFTFLYIDLDDFKQINDQHGHAGGDVVLVDFGSILIRETRKSDLCGRLGGEEFGVLLPDTDIKGAQYFAEKIRTAAKKSVPLFSDQALSYTVSIGASVLNAENIVTLEELVNQSDAALYSAKTAGKDRVCFRPSGVS